MLCDSTAAIGMAKRRGAGSKIRHIDCRILWLQDAHQKGGIALEKVLGKENPADLGTKHLATGAEVWKHLDKMNVELRDGRSELALDAAKL